MNRKCYLIVTFSLLLGWNARAQEKALDLVVGAVYPIRTSALVGDAKPKLGLTFGLLYRRKNEKGDVWSAGLEYQLLQSKAKVQVNNREETQTEKFEMLHFHACPLVWFLDEKKRGYIEAGAFVNYLLHEETELKGNIVNSTKILQRTSLGPSLGFGLQLGESMRKSFVVGLRDDFGAISIGKKPDGNKGAPLKFNNIVLFLGLGI